jgi:hypothetical protein
VDALVREIAAQTDDAHVFGYRSPAPTPANVGTSAETPEML